MFADLGFVVPGSATALLAMVFVMVVRGYLVPPKLVHRDEYDRIKAERDEWKALALRIMDQNQTLIHGSKVVADVLEAIPPMAKDR